MSNLLVGGFNRKGGGGGLFNCLPLRLHSGSGSHVRRVGMHYPQRSAGGSLRIHLHSSIVLPRDFAEKYSTSGSSVFTGWLRLRLRTVSEYAFFASLQLTIGSDFHLDSKWQRELANNQRPHFSILEIAKRLGGDEVQAASSSLKDPAKSKIYRGAFFSELG